MRISRIKTSISATLVLSTLLCIGGQSVAFADNTDNNVTTSDIAQAVQSTGLTGQSSNVHTASDADSAAVSTTDGTTVDVPKDPSDGVGITTSDGATLAVTPPNADDSGNGKRVANGVVAYPAKDGAATAVQATNSGGVRMMTIIDNADAPTNYPYGISVPDGGRIQVTDDGGAVVFDRSGQAVFSAATPWATDANGNAVPTHFEVSADSTKLTQVIDHNIAGVAYPVTADPFLNVVDILLRDAWRGALGCLGGRELAQRGITYFVTWGGAKYVLSRLGTKWIPYIGWVSCGYGAWDGIRG